MKNEHDSRERTSYSYRLGTAEFDEARFELRVAGLPVDVERRALEVLAYLLRHAGEVVTKEELLREVWAGRVTVEKVLPNAITKLRRALGEANAERLLTQARVGYRIDGAVGRVAVGRQLASRLELAIGQAVPGRENFLLRRQLGSNRGSEVWLAEHAKTRERRVYKFGVDGDRLRALKREATLSRVLQESLEDRTHFVDIIDWNFENAPYFLECEYGGQSLLEWSEQGLTATTREQRLGLFLQIADAVAAAHAVGVLHKDIKPANVLIETREPGWLVRLTDFGSGRLLDPDRLETLGITQLGMTLTQSLTADSSSGTPLYVAPEVFAGHTPTVQSDVYALGILLYQLLAGQLTKPMASGWEQDVDDEVLCEDIRLATDGNPERRLLSVAEFATRLREREQRRSARRRAELAEEQARVARESLARNRARRPYLIALVGALLASIAVVLGLYQTAVKARNAAQQELQRATAINRFLNEDLIGRSNPLVIAKGQGASLKDLLLAARERVAKRFAAQPLTEASIRMSLAGLLNTLELMPEAEAEAGRASELFTAAGAGDSDDALRTRSLLALTLTRQGKYELAEQALAPLQQLAATSQALLPRYLVASSLARYYITKGEYPKGLEQLHIAVPLQLQLEPDNYTVRDSLRMDLVAMLTQAARLPEARAEAEGIVAEARARSDDNGLVIAFANGGIARTYMLEGQLDKAEPLLLAAFKTVSELLGPEHTRGLMIQSSLLDVAMLRRDWVTAREYGQRIYEAARGKFGDDHNATNAARFNLAQAMYESGDVAAAVENMTAVREKFTARFGASHPQAQVATFWLAAMELELRHTDKAAALVEALDVKALQAEAAESRWPLRVDTLRGVLAAQRGDARKAATLLQPVLEALEKDPADIRLYRAALLALGRTPPP